MTSYNVGYGAAEEGGFENPEVIHHGQGHQRRGLGLIVIFVVAIIYSIYVTCAIIEIEGYGCHSRLLYICLILGLLWTLTILSLIFRFLGPYIEIGLGWRGRYNMIFIFVFWIKVAICYAIIILSVVAVGVKSKHHGSHKAESESGLCPNWSFILPSLGLIVYGGILGFLSASPIGHATFTSS